MRVALAMTFALVAIYFDGTEGHGMLMEPVNRGSAWRKGFKTPVNYDDNGNYCGGMHVQIQNGGKCGLCGDNYASPRPRKNENTGELGVGQIVKTYTSGQLIDLVVRIDANHRGYFRYAVCPLNHGKELETEECFNRYPVKLEDGSDKFMLGSRRGNVAMKAYLPAGLTCKHCVFRWEYVAGNNWGRCPDGANREGCGPQETYRTCSDITIN